MKQAVRGRRALQKRFVRNHRNTLYFGKGWAGYNSAIAANGSTDSMSDSRNCRLW
jgi:hypothetical protein